jgi:hypothetical protein
VSESRRGDSPRHGTSGRAAIGPVLLLCALASGATHAATTPQPLAIEIDGPLFSGAPLVLELRQSGSLAGRRLAVQVGIDGASAGRFEATGDLTRITVESARLTPGVHEIVVKSGSVRAAATVRVWPGWMPWVAGALLLLVVLLTVRRARSGRGARAASDSPQ